MCRQDLPGLTKFAWMCDPECEPSPASKFVQRYPRNRVGYHFCIVIFGQFDKEAGTVTAVFLFKTTSTSLMSWFLNETNVPRFPHLPVLVIFMFICSNISVCKCDHLRFCPTYPPSLHVFSQMSQYVSEVRAASQFQFRHQRN